MTPRFAPEPSPFTARRGSQRRLPYEACPAIRWELLSAQLSLPPLLHQGALKDSDFHSSGFKLMSCHTSTLPVDIWQSV